jgi:uncharacterized membrane protein YphA (DoxX/SURF4 family)
MRSAAGRGQGGREQGGNAPSLGLRLLAVMLGVFFLFMGLNKLAWLGDSNILADKFQIFLKGAPPATRWYIETIAIPAAPLFARLVPLAELSAAAALLLGFWTRLAAALALVMVLNFHLATGEIFTRGFLLDGAGPPVVGALLALAIGGRNLPLSVSRQ